jgi:hypothetical protein
MRAWPLLMPAVSAACSKTIAPDPSVLRSTISIFAGLLQLTYPCRFGLQVRGGIAGIVRLA